MKESLDAALEYARRGWRVFPCKPNKKPLTAHGLSDATCDEGQIRAWWKRWPNALVAIRTGAISGMFVIDSDIKDDGTDGEENLQALAAQHSPLPECPETQTPRGGRHRIFAWPTGGRVIRNDTGRKLAPGIDVRGEGGYIIAPPSPGYIWDCPDAPLEPPQAPEWLLKVLCAEDSRSTVLSNEIPSGQRNNTLASLAGSMRRVGMSESEIYAALIKANEDRCNPPLKEREVKKIAESVAKYEPDQLAVAVVEDHWAQDQEEPKPTGPPDPGPFPDRLLDVPGFIREVVDYDLATAFKPQPVLALGAALCLQAVLAARKVRDPRGNRTNIYIVGVAASGAGKDHPRKVNKNVLFMSGLDHLEGNEEFASDSGMIKAVELNPAVLFQVDEVGRMLKTIGDARHSHLYNISTALMKLYSSADTVFRGKAYADHKRNAVIVQPCVSLYGLTVPEYLYESLSVENLTDGFLARLMIFEADRNPSRQRVPILPLPSSVINAARWWGQFKPGGNLAGQHPEPAVVEYTDEAGEIFDDFAALIETESRSGDRTGQAIWSRAEEKACRLALIYACSADRDNLVIGPGAATWACAISEYLVRRTLFIASQWVAENAFDAKQKRVLRIIRDAGGTIGRNELCRKTQALTQRERAEVVENLKAAGRIVERTEATGGRPKVVYVLP